MNGRRRILVVDDHPIVRRGLTTLLSGEDWVAEVVEAATAAAAHREATCRRIDVVAMDVLLPDGDGVEVTRRIVASRPHTAVLMLTMADDTHVVTRALLAGARGYLLKDTDPDLLVDALRTVANGGTVLGPTIGAAILAATHRTVRRPRAPFDLLTARELSIIGHLASGESNARIARLLGLSEKTVRNQLSAAFTKLAVTDRVQAALLARDAGIGPDDTRNNSSSP